MPQPIRYLIKDPQSSATYGPGDIPTLRQWIAEGRLTPSMLIAPEGSDHWQPLLSHPDLAPLFPGAATPSPSSPYTTPTAPIPYHSPSLSTPATNAFAIVSLICSSVSLLGCCCWFLSIPVAILGIVFGFIARSQIKASNGAQSGDQLALTGVILGFLSLILALGWIAFFFSGFTTRFTPPHPL